MLPARTRHSAGGSPDRSDAVTTTAVFADPSGRRWRRMRAASILLMILAIGAVATFLTHAYVSPEVSAGSVRAMLSKRDTGLHAPIIGRGPLERVIRLERTGTQGTRVLAVEPFTGQELGQLSAGEARAVGSSPYAVQRYGYSASVTKTISLTFDDGPDAAVTTQLLDVLARHHVPATFFVVGRNVVRRPDIVARMAREGHTVGVHTMTHPDVAEQPDWREQAELVASERVLRQVTGRRSSIWRMPYTSPETSTMQSTIDGLLRAQRLGYIHASYDFDTLDWVHDARPEGRAEDIALPDLSTGENITVLLHDAGGPNRTRSVAYVERLITAAAAAGYTFHTMPQVAPAIAAANAPITPSMWDHLTYVVAEAMFAWPKHLMTLLFALAVGLLVVAGLANCLLALVRHRRRARMVWPHPREMDVDVSVVLAAFNEERVIGRTLAALSASTYPIAEIVVVDDGSSDATSDVVRLHALGDPRITLLRQENAGKATALNQGLERARGEVVVTLDADTLVTPSTVTNLVRHFAVDENRSLGAVAGVVRVGNRRRNLLTRWQALEYLTQIGLERAAQDTLGAISIVPGACAAWRREAILTAGGYSSVTLAEDCDLALALHRLGWRITQDDDAVALTEAPETVDDLLKQRIRWTFGTLQAMYKNRDMAFARRFGLLGWYVLPNYLACILLPLLFIPFVAVMTVLTLQAEGTVMLLTYFAAFLAIQVAFAAVAVRLMGERWTHLLMVPIYRIVHEPLRAYLLYRSAHLVCSGRRLGWNKLDRTGSVQSDVPAHPVAAVPAPAPLPAALPARVLTAAPR